MFNNLIESSSHRGEFKRRGSFLLFTTATYVLLFAIAGVASIYAYDARLSEQNLELVTMMSPVDFEPPRDQSLAIERTARDSGETADNHQNYHEREFAMASVNQPDVAPDRISTTPNKNEPLPEVGSVRFTGRDRDAGVIPGGGPSGSGSRSGLDPKPLVVLTEQPPDLPVRTPAPKTIRKNIINSEAISLPIPRYPEIARQVRAQGVVLIQVLIDESGKVVSAQVVKGHPMLTPTARQAAMGARFSPTMIGDQPVKVSGTITYNFVMQ